MPGLKGHLKWFDATRGFGFVVPEDGGNDVLLHENVLFDFGASTVMEGTFIECEVAETDRGRQVVTIYALDIPQIDPTIVLQEILPENTDIGSLLETSKLHPARVKWFDKSKGFGFVNVFGSAEDIFVHVEVMRAFGMITLERGSALAIKYTDGPKGLIAIELRQWDDAAGLA